MRHRQLLLDFDNRPEQLLNPDEIFERADEELLSSSFAHFAWSFAGAKGLSCERREVGQQRQCFLP